MKKVAVGSYSGIKIEAAKTSFPDCEIVGLSKDFKSAVSAQPVGKEETLKGAQHRAYAAKAAHPDAFVSLGIENGMYQEGSQWFDVAAIVVLHNDTEHVVWSDVLEIPPNPPFEKGPEGEWSILKDPHVVLTGGKKPRAKFLTDAIDEWKKAHVQ